MDRPPACAPKPREAPTLDPEPCTRRNNLCVFELATGMPVLRHWADSGGNLMYYGAVPGSVLVVRGISAVYNYDYISDLRLHLDGTIQVGATGA